MTAAAAALPRAGAAVPADLLATIPMLQSDANLERAKQVEGYKVLPPCVLYGKIGQGGMGAVYRGRHLNLDIDVAVKCLKPGLLADDEQFVVRFRREARSAARINHQNVVRVFDVSEEQGLHYIVMELVQGETARQRVQRKQRLQVGEALEILHGAALGLGEAHSKGFIHRDVKPDNIMISTSGQVKVADLGLAKPAGGGQLSLVSGTNAVMGTPQYMPPEQWENTSTVTPAADVWSLGATLYYLLVGGEAIAKDSLPRIMQRIVLQPFPDVREQRADVPADVAELIAKATAKSPHDRFQDAGELAAAIERLDTRRESLQGFDATVDGEHNTLLSPPPAKTLAKIKFWLDEQQIGKGAAGRVAADASTGSSGTEAALPPHLVRGRRRTALVAVAAALLALIALTVWQPWRKADLLAEVDRLEQAGQYELAISEALRVHASAPQLAGKAERLARLHAARAGELLQQQDLPQALAEAKRSLGYSANESASLVQRSALAKAVTIIDRELVRLAPLRDPQPRDQAVTFRGRSGSDLARSLRIVGQPVELAADGSFSASLPLGGADTASVEAILVTDDVVTLAAWPIIYVDATARANVGPAVDNLDPIVPAPVAVEIMPPAIQLVGDQISTLVVRAPAEASIYVDGQLAQRGPGTEAYAHVVRSDLDVPAPVEVLVKQPGKSDVRRSVAVTRLAAALSFVREPSFVGLLQLRDRRWVTAMTAVEVQGAVSDDGVQLLLDGQEVRDVQWRGREFTASLRVPSVGANRLRLAAQRRYFRAAQAELDVYRLVAPVLALTEGTAAQASVASATYAVVVAADEWTTRIEAGSGSETLALRRDRAADVFRGTVRLAVGENVIAVRAVNVLDQAAAIELRITRLPASARPETQSVALRLDGQLQQVGNGKEVFLREPAPMVVGVSDPTATISINGEAAERAADGTVSIAKWLTEERAVAIEIVCENGAGRSPKFRFVAWLDATPPTAEWQPLAQPVAKGKPFMLRGRWNDAGGLDPGKCSIGGIEVQLSPRGVAKQGTWQLRHPGLDAPTALQLVVTDRAGNQTTVPLDIAVQ